LPNRIRLMRIILLAGLVFLTSCLHDKGDNSNNNQTVPVPEVSEGMLLDTVDYVILGNAIIVETQEDIEIFSYCSFADELVLDTFYFEEAGFDTTEFEIVGNTFVLAGDIDTLESGAVIQYFTTLTAVSNQSGVTGVWNNPTPGYEVLSGSMTAAEKIELDQELAFIIMMMSEMSQVTYYISNTQIIIHIPEEINSNLDYFAEDYYEQYYADSLDAAQAAITLETIDNATVKLTGGTTGEIITVSQDNQGNRTYTSNNPDNADYTYYQNPTSCPNENRPDWMLAFYLDNGRENPPYLYMKAFKKRSAQSGGWPPGVK